MLLLPADILGLGDNPSSFGVTLALILTFVVITGGLANVLIGYAVGQVLAERKQNQERMQGFEE